MKTKRIVKTKCITLFCFLLCASGWSQDSLQLLPPISQVTSIPKQPFASWAPYQPLYQAPQDLPYDLQWGRLRLLASASLQTEWNDNVNLVNTNPIGDFTLQPMLTMQGLLSITEDNQLSFAIGAGYAAYLQHPADSQLLITPDSVVSFNARAGDFKLNFHDRVSYVEDSSLYGNVSGLAALGGLFNTVGADVYREFGPVAVTLGYDHQDFMASATAYSILNNGSDTGTARVALSPRAGLLTGLEAGGGATTYSKGALSDYESYNVGAFTDWQITSRLGALFRAGFVDHLYDSPALTQSNSAIPGYYLSAVAQAQLNDKLSAYLEGGREETVSIDGSLLRQWYGGLGATWEIIRRGMLTSSLRYENAHIPFENSFGAYNYFAPNYQRVEFVGRFRYPIARRLDANLSYNLIVKESPTYPARYTLNDIAIGLVFSF
jgi:hypothetical protein